MFKADVLGDDTLDRISQAYARFPDEIDAYVRRKLRPFVSQQVDKRLRRSPGTPHHPLRWTPSRHPEDANKPPNTAFGYYSRQKAWYFWKHGGKPYHRTGKLERGWAVRADYSGGLSSITLSNSEDYVPFVYGWIGQQSWQQGFHKDTGWPNLTTVVQVIMLEADEFSESGLLSLIEDLAESA